MIRLADYMKNIFVIVAMLLVIITSLLFPQQADADWNSTLEAAFSGTYSKVCTFDDYDDWVGTLTGDVNTASNMPKISGTQGIFSYYSFWGTYPAATDYWIKNHGSSYVWTQGNANDSSAHKSLAVDIGGTKYGPSRLSVFFGDKNANNPGETGYSDVYIFFMVYFVRNNWATSGTFGGTYTYSEASYPTYATDLSWKFGTVNMGCDHDASCDQYGNGSNYSFYHVIPHIKAYMATERKPSFVLEPNCANNGRATIIPSDNLLDTASIPGWVGIELRLRNVNVGGSLTTYFDAWIYDTSGNATQVHDNDTYVFSSQPITDLWNNFEWGGNCSSCTFGDGMQSHYYVDDLIIHNSRIGPTYFSLLAGTTTYPTLRGGIVGRIQ